MGKTRKVNISALEKITKLISGSGSPINSKISSIEVKKFTKKFGKFLSTSDINFSVGHGVIHGFIGPNGSGKTTTIKALIGAYVPSSGSLKINGHKAGSVKANKLIGYIPERASFPKHLNSVDYLAWMGQISGLKFKVAKKRAIEILDALGLKSQAKRKPITFSSGMQKKILLAQSLLTDPSILILDEPAANLDPSSRRELFDQLIELRNQGKTIFISSHVLAELERIVDEITFLYFGELLFTGSVEDFTSQNDSIFVKTNNNNILVKYLESKKYKWDGDIKTEIEILSVSKTKAKSLLKNLTLVKGLSIKSFRENDLQSAYEKLSIEADKKGKGKQMLKGKSAVYRTSKTKGGSK